MGRNSLFEAQIDYKKKKFYALDMFPYPSGAGLHVGHLVSYTPTDIVSRYKELKVLMFFILWDTMLLDYLQSNMPLRQEFTLPKQLKKRFLILKNNSNLLVLVLIGVERFPLVIQITINGLKRFF